MKEQESSRWMWMREFIHKKQRTFTANFFRFLESLLFFYFSFAAQDFAINTRGSTKVSRR
jgi:hypothetical protein